MFTELRYWCSLCKSLFLITCLAACSVNPATGQQQFTALMSPAQESRVGAEEHQKIIKQFGAPKAGDPVQVYVSKVGQKVAAHTERPDISYKFFLLDDEMVNAFALPGGYVYVTRGLLAQAGSETELAAVLGHEVGHVTGRHSAERYSRNVVTSLGAMVLSAALDSSSASRALGLGSDLFLKSYSRGQEHEADALGLRYLTNAGYHPDGMANFLTALNGNTMLQNRINGGARQAPGWFSTHPLTTERIAQTVALAGQYPKQGLEGRDDYLTAIDGLVYGESAKQGFVRDINFYHTKMDFTFSVPAGFKMVNQPGQVVATDKNGAAIVFDAATPPQNMDAFTYMTQVWMAGEALAGAEKIDINGKSAATASFSGKVGNHPVTIRIVAMEWKPGHFFRFQMAIPNGAPAALIEELKRTTYSLRHLTDAEKRDIQPYRLRVVTAGAGDTVSMLARKMPHSTYQEERFRALNALGTGENLTAGRRYKVVSER